MFSHFVHSKAMSYPSDHSMMQALFPLTRSTAQTVFLISTPFPDGLRQFRQWNDLHLLRQTVLPVAGIHHREKSLM
jgi:hypothetical protein